MIRVRGLSRRFGRLSAHPVLDRISFRVEEGETMGILGVDGAGKTTLLRILATVLRPSSGEVSIRGFDAVADGARIRDFLGYLPQTPYLRTDMSVADCLDYWMSVDGLPKKEREARRSSLLEFLDLSKDLRETVRLATTFVQRRLYLAVALLAEPTVILLDEPLAGLSASEREYLLQKIRALQDRGKTIVMSASKLRDIRPVAHEVVTLLAGRATRAYKTPDLLRLVGDARHARVFIEADAPLSQIQSTVAEIPGIVESRQVGPTVILFVDPSTFDTGRLKQSLVSGGIATASVREAVISVSDIFRTISRREAT